MADASVRPALEDALQGTGIRVAVGADAIDAVAAFPAADLVVNAAVGAAGLRPTVAAVEAGKTVALANKESLVLAGAFLMARARATGATILPVDSEHASLFQCLWGRDPASVRALVLTASGGPFREASEADLARVTPERALEHPTWKMGPRITIDSATLMNKGFEVIEARWLFDVPQDRIRVVVHPQSIVHGLVELSDGSLMAHMGEPDMRLPIASALAHPEPSAVRLRPLSLSAVGTLTFEEPDRRRFPCLALAEAALRAGARCPPS